MKKCESCEKMILEGAVRCSYCGALQKCTGQKKMEPLVETEKAAEPKVSDELEKAAKQKNVTEPKKLEESEAPGKTEKAAEWEVAANPAGEEKSKQRATSKYCSNCGMKLEKSERYCPRCGKKAGESEKEPQKVTYDMGKTAQEIYGSTREKVLQKPENIRTIFGIIAGIFYLCGALRYFSRYCHYGDSNLNFLIMAVCCWNVFILYKISFRCSRQNGANLMYGLLAGCGMEVLLFIIRVSQSYYYEIGTLEYLEFLRSFVVAGLGYYLMKKDGYLWNFLPDREKQESKEMKTERAKYSEVRTEDTTSDSENAAAENLMDSWNKGQERLLQIVGGKLFFVLCVVYTGELLYQLFSDFSFFNVVGKLLSIFLCVFLWQICMEGRKKDLRAGSFENVSLIMKIQYVIKIVAGIFVCIIGVFSGPIGFIATLVMTIMDICYIGSFRKMAISIQKIAEGADGNVKVSFYPVLVLGINILLKAFSFFKALTLMSAMNYSYGLLNSYGSAVGSGIVSFLQEFDIGTGTSSGIISSMMNMLLMPFQNWIQAIFGGYENPLILLLGLVVLVCEFLVIRQLRVWKKVTEK